MVLHQIPGNFQNCSPRFSGTYLRCDSLPYTFAEARTLIQTMGLFVLWVTEVEKAHKDGKQWSWRLGLAWNLLTLFLGKIPWRLLAASIFCSFFLPSGKTGQTLVIIHAGLFWMMSGAPMCTGNISYRVFQCACSLVNVTVELAAVIV